MRLLVIRHGESEADLLDVHEGRADFELIQKGHQQATAMAEWIAKHYQINKIYCSPLKRAHQTALHLADQLSMECCVEEKLMEFNNGLLAGLDHKTADEKYPEPESLPIHASLYEQESQLEFRFRADYILSKIISETGKDETIAIVTHGGMVNQLYHPFLQLLVKDPLRFCTGDTGIHEWVIRDDLHFIVHSNSMAHLESIRE